MQNSSINSTSYEDYINSISDKLANYFVLVSSAIGITGNLISMVVFIRLAIKNPKINMGFLYTFQSLIDLLVLIFTLFVFRGSVYLFGYVVLNINNSYCRAFAFLRRFLLHISSWMSVLISFDRFTFVLYQNRFKFMKNKLILSAVMFGMFILIAIVDIVNFFYYIAGSSKTSILFTCIGSDAVTMASDIISILFRTYIPLILMIIFNSLIIYRLFKSARSSKIVRQRKGSSSSMRKEHQFTIAAMFCNLFFFLSNFPISVFYIFYDVNLYSGVFKSDSYLSAIYSLYYNIFLNISFIFQTCSIFMYFAFNKLFRRELFRIVFELLPCMVFRNLKPETSASYNDVNNASKSQNFSLYFF